MRTVKEFMGPEGAKAPTTAEKRLVEAVRAGEGCVLLRDDKWQAVQKALDAGKTPKIDLAREIPEATDACRVRAALLRLLINDATQDSGKTERGVELIGGWVEGVLDLSFVHARGWVMLDFCRFTDRPNFEQAALAALSLRGSHLPGLFAPGMRVEGDVRLPRAKVAGTVVVNGAKIGGQLACNGATLDGQDGMALNAQGVETGQSLFLRNVTATNTVHLTGARIGGQLNCLHATLDGNGGEALNAQGVETGEDFFLTFVIAKGTVAFNGAKIGGLLVCDGTQFASTKFIKQQNTRVRTHKSA
jgi:hypothetical protein